MIDLPSRRSCARQILKLPGAMPELVDNLFDAARSSFVSDHACDLLRVPEEDVDALDSRSGYVRDRKREWFELHCSMNPSFGQLNNCPAASHLLEYSRDFASACQTICHDMLQAISASGETADSSVPPLRSLLGAWNGSESAPLVLVLLVL